jgi:hemerythrin-like domain-containing protein
MYTATQNLENDHVQIIRLTNVMEAMLGFQKPDLSDLDKVVFLIRNYADGFHHFNLI